MEERMELKIGLIQDGEEVGLTVTICILGNERK